jgi:2'-5' RNA ligase
VKYFLAITPPPPLSQRIVDFHSPWGQAKNPPHITLKAPNSLASPAIWLTRVTALCGQTNPFEVTLAGVEQFGRTVLYLRAYAPELVTLHHQLLAITQSTPAEQVCYFEGPAFLPHLTLAHAESGLSEDTIAHLAQLATAEWTKPVRFMAQTLDIYCSHQEHGGYQLQTTLPLAGCSPVFK